MTVVYAKEGFTGIVDGSAQRPGTPPAPGQCETYREGLLAHDEQDHGGDSAGEADSGDPGQSDGYQNSGIISRHGVEHGGRRGAGGGLRERDEGRVKMNKKAKVYAPHVPVYIGKKIMATLFNAMTTALLLNLHQHDRDGLWEIACWLSEASEENNIKARRINLVQGFDLYPPST